MDSFFGIGVMELAFIAILALIILGPERLPGAARETAKIFGQIRALSSEFTSQFSEELQVLDEINPKKLADDIVKETMNPPKKPTMDRTKPSPSANAQPTTVRTHKRPDKPLADDAEQSILPPSLEEPTGLEAANGVGADPEASSDPEDEPTSEAVADVGEAADGDAAEQAE